ncbi:hypothetical protein PHLCEN_2v3494, partial [Hermanssonia centrifuga]
RAYIATQTLAGPPDTCKPYPEPPPSVARQGHQTSSKRRAKTWRDDQERKILYICRK